MQTFNILHDLSIAVSPEKIFEAIVNPVHLNNWWTKECEGSPVVGNTYRFYFTPEYDWRAEVVQCEQNKKFELSMTESSEGWEPTSFGFELEGSGNNTLLHFHHKDWAVNSHHYRRTSFCWAILLNGLKNYVEKGVIVPFEERV